MAAIAKVVYITTGTSNIVQLSRVKSFQGLYLLRPVTLSDLNAKLDALLVQEGERITHLAKATDTAWQQIEATDDFRLGRPNFI